MTTQLFFVEEKGRFTALYNFRSSDMSVELINEIR